VSRSRKNIGKICYKLKVGEEVSAGGGSWGRGK
jgi:hypothetical protein